MEAIAENLGLSYKKINPLELDLDVVTRMIAKPFALKHLVVPIALEDGELKVAMYNPLNHEALDDVVAQLAATLGVEGRHDVSPAGAVPPVDGSGQQRRVLVVGGGPGGMEAARLLAEQGRIEEAILLFETVFGI